MELLAAEIDGVKYGLAAAEMFLSRGQRDLIRKGLDNLAKGDICELLAPLMEETQKRDPSVWVRARIAQLRREIASLEKKL